MEDLSYLQFFITEDIYVLPGDVVKSEAIEIPLNDELDSTVQEVSDDTSSNTQSPKPMKIAKAQPANNLSEAAKKEPEVKETSSPSAAQKQTVAYTPPVYEGYFLKKILIVVHASGLGFEHKELLLKILGAINLSKEDVAILPSGHIKSKEDFEWMTSGDKNGLIAFGLPEKWKQQIIQQSELYVLKDHNGYKLLFSDNLTEIHNNVAAKKQLWAELQKLK